MNHKIEKVDIDKLNADIKEIVKKRYFEERNRKNFIRNIKKIKVEFCKKLNVVKSRKK